MVEALDGLPPVKLHCSVLAEEAIHEAIADYYRKEGKLTEEEIKEKCQCVNRRFFMILIDNKMLQLNYKF